MDVVIVTQMGFGVKSTVIADAPCLFSNLRDQREHFICNYEGWFITHFPDLAFGTIIPFHKPPSNFLGVILRIILHCLSKIYSGCIAKKKMDARAMCLEIGDSSSEGPCGS